MNTVTNRTMNKRIALLALALIAVTLYFGGCVTGDSGAGSQVEVVSPTGCLKAQGRYYDPKLKDCVQVDDMHRALVLDSYRYVNQLAEKGELEEAEYLVILKYATLARMEELWTFLRENGAKLRYFSAFLPEGIDYEPNWGKPIMPETKVWTGSMSPTCGWDYRSDAKPDEETIINFTEKGIQDLEATYNRQMLERRKAIFEDGGCRVARMSVIAKPDVMRDFWNAYLDDIEAIQPQVTTMDKAQGELGPSQPLVEGE